MTTVACLWVRGHLHYYTAEYVLKLQAMVARHMDRPYRFVCLTDYPKKQIPRGLDTIRVPPLPAKVMAWWWKLRVFDPAIGLSGRVLYIDLDSLVVGSLAPMLDLPTSLALCPDEATFKPKNDLKIVKRFNGSVMVFDAGVHEDLWTRYDPVLTTEYWSDQDMIGLWKPDAATFPPAWVPRLSVIRDVRPDKAGPAIIVLAKKPKPHLAVANDEFAWVRKVWREA
jgi:hypothetical protein